MQHMQQALANWQYKLLNWYLAYHRIDEMACEGQGTTRDGCLVTREARTAPRRNFRLKAGLLKTGTAEARAARHNSIKIMRKFSLAIQHQAA